MSKKKWLLAALWLVVVIGAPLLGHFVRQRQAGRCHFNGLPIMPAYRVRITDTAGRSWQFCCLECAKQWRSGHPDAQRTFVTDEATGLEMPAESAYYVRSTVATTPATGNRVHVFSDRAAAMRHAKSAHGVLLTGAARPVPPDDGGEKATPDDSGETTED